MIVDNPGEGNSRRKPPAPHPKEYYRGNVNITNFDGPFVLLPPPYGRTSVVSSNLMQMLTARGLFVGLPSEDPYAHIAKLRSVCKICVGRQD